MKPDQRWFPTNRNERAAWFRNFAKKFTDLGPELGFAQSEIDSLNADNAFVQFTTLAITSLENTMSAVRSYEKLMTESRIGTTSAEFPVFTIPPMPDPVPPGIYQRLERLVRQIRLAPNYSPSVGANLGIIPINRRITNLAEFTPKISVRVNPQPHSFTVRCPRGKFRAFEVWVKRAGEADWKREAFATSSPIDISLEPTTPGMPEKISVRTRMSEANRAVGNYSDILEVTLNG